jgi:hypothetical protein
MPIKLENVGIAVRDLEATIDRGAVGKSTAAVRQVAHRAREHVAARRPRVQVNRSEQKRVVERCERDTVISLVVEDGRITRM